jgi:abortive infection bacteriophage resistance protein
MPTYSKPALTIKTQLQLLRRRGMVIADEQFAITVLESCNFYRFGGYAIAFWLTPHRPQQYQPGTTFEDVVNIINFDRALRMLTMDAIERLEVAVRSIITSKASIFSVHRIDIWKARDLRVSPSTVNLLQNALGILIAAKKFLRSITRKRTPRLMYHRLG